MARKAKDSGDKRVLFNKLRQIWTDISPADWLLLLADLAPTAEFKRSGPHIKGKCIFHDDKGPSFIVTPGKGMVKCFGCSKTFYNPITFIAALKTQYGKTSGEGACSFGDAVLLLKKRFGLKAAIPEALYEKVKEHEVYQRHKTTLVKYMCDLAFEAILAYPNDLTANNLYYAKEAVEFLISRKLGDYAVNEPRAAGADESTTGSVADPHGIWATICANQLIGIFPSVADVSNKFGKDSEELKFFCSYFAQYTADSKFLGFLVFPMHDEPDSVARFKLRSSSLENKEMFFVDDAYDKEMNGFRGFYGLHYYRPFLGAQTVDGHAYMDTVCLVEGEFDALACIAQQIRRTSYEFVVFAMGGSSVGGLDRLGNMGIEKIRIVGDADKGGDIIIKRCLETTSTDKIAFSIFKWPDTYTAWRDPNDPNRRVKDPDEAIKALGYPKFAWHLNVTQNEKLVFYDQPYEWCYEQASDAIEKTAGDDVRQRGRIGAEWGKLLRNSQECKTFCTILEKNYSIDATILYREIRAKDENEEAFVDRLKDVLDEGWHFIGVQNAESRRRLLLAWNKEKRIMEYIVLNDEKSLETVLARYYGTIYDFITEKVGDPAFMTAEGEESSFNVAARTKKYREYLNFALLKIAKGLPSVDHAPTKAQGLHYIDTVEGVSHSYMVNGRDVYHLAHGPGDKFEVTRLDGPSDQGTIFDNSGDAWLHSVKGVDDLKNAVSVPDLFLRIRKMITSAWTFRYQEHDATFLAAYIMCLPVMTVFTRQTAIMLNAEHESGKSRFTSGFIGGSGFPGINIVACAIAMQGYTAASIRQQRNNSSLALCLEEFEDYGGNDAKSIIIRKCLELFRDLISESAVNWSIGTVTGESRTYHLRFPLICCAIRPLRDAASLSRFIAFELVKDPTRKDPVMTLTELFGYDGMRETRHNVATGLLPFMPRLRALQTDIEKEYSANGRMPAHVSSRFRESLYPVMAMLQLVQEEAMKLGKDAPAVPDFREFAFAFAETRKDQLARLKTTSENEQIFESVLSSAIQTSDRNNISNVTSIRQMLADLNALDEVNKTKKGVYLDKLNEWLVVNWIEATQGVLANTKYKNETPTYLKQVSERSPHFVKDVEVRKARVLERLITEMGPCQSLELISVFSVKHVLAAARAHRDSMMGTPPAAAKTEEESTSPDVAQQSDDIIA